MEECVEDQCEDLAWWDLLQNNDIILFSFLFLIHFWSTIPVKKKNITPKNERLSEIVV